MRLTIRGSKRESVLATLLGLAPLLLTLSGCAVFGVTTPTPKPTATIDPLTIPQGTPNIDCPTAVQLILQKDVNEVQTQSDSTGFVYGIDVYVSEQTQINGVAISQEEQNVQPPLQNGSIQQCLNQILTAVKSVNMTLPANAQIVVTNDTESAG